jgi:hypothetical protein
MERLIPLVNQLRHTIPLTFSTMFPNILLKEMNLTGKIECHDLQASDYFFDKLQN